MPCRASRLAVANSSSVSMPLVYHNYNFGCSNSFYHLGLIHLIKSEHLPNFMFIDNEASQRCRFTVPDQKTFGKPIVMSIHQCILDTSEKKHEQIINFDISTITPSNPPPSYKSGNKKGGITRKGGITKNANFCPQKFSRLRRDF